MGRLPRKRGSWTAAHTVVMPAQRQQHSPSGIDHLEHGLADHLRGEESTVHPVDSGRLLVDSVDGGLRGGLVDW